MNDEYELDDGPKSYHVDLDTLDSVSDDITKYQGIDHILLIVEDDPENLKNRVNAAKRHLGDYIGICACENTNVAQKELEKYRKGSPNARLDSLLDFNMNLSEESKKSTEGLYFDSNFQSYLNNGGVVVFNTGYPSQVRQSMDIMDTQNKYDGVLLLLAEKAKTEIDDIFRVFKLAEPKKIPKLRKVAEKFDYDLSSILTALRGRK